MTLTDQPTRSYERPAPGSSQAWDGYLKNVGPSERWLSGAGGAGLVLLGMRQRSLFGAALAVLGGAMVYRGVTGHCPAYGALGIDTTDDVGGARPEKYFHHGIHVEQSFTIGKSREELYSYWRDLRNLPSIMRHLERVDVTDDKHSHWVAKGPAGKRVEWDAEIINDEPNALIAWRSLQGADVDNAGSVRFIEAPANRGSEVKVVLDYIPPAGRISQAIAYLFGREPSQQVKEDLRRFKRVMETGEVPTTQGQPRGQCH